MTDVNRVRNGVRLLLKLLRAELAWDVYIEDPRRPGFKIESSEKRERLRKVSKSLLEAERLLSLVSEEDSMDDKRRTT